MRRIKMYASAGVMCSEVFTNKLEQDQSRNICRSACLVWWAVFPSVWRPTWTVYESGLDCTSLTHSTHEGSWAFCFLY